MPTSSPEQRAEWKRQAKAMKSGPWFARASILLAEVEALEERIAAALDYLDLVQLPRAARIANVQTILTLDTAPSSLAVDAQADHE